VVHVLASVSMGAYLLRVHPILRAELKDEVLWADP